MTLLSNQGASEPFETIHQQGTISCLVKKLPLSPGNYCCNLCIKQNGVMEDWIQEAVMLRVGYGSFFGSQKMPPPSHGGILVEQAWSVD